MKLAAALAAVILLFLSGCAAAVPAIAVGVTLAAPLVEAGARGLAEGFATPTPSPAPAPAPAPAPSPTK